MSLAVSSSFRPMAFNETVFFNVPFVNVLNQTVRVDVSPTLIGEKRPLYSLVIDISGFLWLGEF